MVCFMVVLASKLNEELLGVFGIKLVIPGVVVSTFPSFSWLIGRIAVTSNKFNQLGVFSVIVCKRLVGNKASNLISGKSVCQDSDTVVEEEVRQPLWSYVDCHEVPFVGVFVAEDVVEHNVCFLQEERQKEREPKLPS